MSYCWNILKHEVWVTTPIHFVEDDLVLFKMFGWELGLSKFHALLLENEH